MGTFIVGSIFVMILLFSMKATYTQHKNGGCSGCSGGCSGGNCCGSDANAKPNTTLSESHSNCHTSK